MSTQNSIRVLHVDDEPDFGELTALFLERTNDRLSVVTETSTVEGLDRLATDDVDVVVSDYDMPGRNGIDFLAAVRETHPDLPFVLFTGKGSEEVASEAISAGVTDYLQKSTGSDQYALLANRIVNAVGKHRAEQQLRETQETYEQIARIASDAFWTWDVASDELTLSDGFERVFGHTAGRVPEGREWASEKVHPDDREAILADVQTTLDTCTTWAANEYRFRRGDGTYAEVLSRRSVIVDESGAADRMVGVLVDLSETKRHGRSLEQYRTVLEALPDAVWMLDADGVVQFANEMSGQRVGMDQGSLVGQRYDELLANGRIEAERIDDFVRDVEAVLAGETELARTEFVARLGDQKVVRDVLMVPVVVEGETWAIGISRDITERHLADERFRNLFENLSDPIVAVTYDGEPVQAEGERGTVGAPRITAVNRAFERVFGYDAETVTGRTISELIVPTEHAEEGEVIDRLIREGKAVNREVIRSTRDGSHRNFVFQVVHTEDQEDQQVFYGVYRDITETKRYSERLETQNAKLDAFAGKVTHDLRNPLAMAQGWLEIARESSTDDSIEKVASALSRMEVIITDVLSLARHGEQVVELVSVPLQPAVEVAWRMAGRESATLEVVGPLGDVDASETRLVALFENLFSNAVEHGGLGVTVRVGRLPDGGFFVEDDGPGIPEANRELVFSSGYTTTETGTGFGLAIVEEIADAHGWTVSVGEAAAGGARFEITGTSH